MMTSFAGVVQSWRDAHPKHIHPMREHDSEAAYWESGKPQAQFVLDLVGEGATVLDFGCGDGRVALPMHRLNLNVIAADAAPEMIERLEHAMRVQGIERAAIQTMTADGTKDFGILVRGQMDAVNARAVFIHHAHADVATMVRNLSAALKSGGYLIADWPTGPHHERRDWIDVTTWDVNERARVADAAGLTLVSEGNPARNIPSVWVKR